MRFVEEKLKRMEQWIRKNKNKNTTIRIRILSHHRISSLLSSLFPFTIEITLKNFVYTEIRCSRNFRFSSSPPPPSNEILRNISLIAVSFRVAVSNHTVKFRFRVSLDHFFFFLFIIYRILTSKKFTRKSIPFFHTIKKIIVRR